MRRTLSAGLVAVTTAILAAAPVSAHGLSGVYDAPLPLAVYLAGAAVAVGLSFVFAVLSSGTWKPRPLERTRTVPRFLVVALKAIGSVAWAWVIAQLIVGGSSSAEVGSLFTWVYGWVGLAILCAIVGPIWSWLDPFTTIHEIGSWVASRLGLPARRHATYPAAAATWPAIGLFVFFVWLELAYVRANMGLVVLGYTIVVLGGMTVYGRDVWRRHGEVFSVWFGLLGRLALYVPVGPTGSRVVRRQHFPDGLLGHDWDRALVTLVAVSVAAILYDGLSQTEPFYELFGLPAIAGSTVLLLGFLAIVAAPRPVADAQRRRGRRRSRPPPDLAGISHRPLPDVPARRRPAHRRRGVGPVPARMGPLRHGVLRAGRHVARAVARVDGHVRRRRRRARPRGVGRAPRGRARDPRCDPCAPRSGPAGAADGRADDAHALEPRPERHRDPGGQPRGGRDDRPSGRRCEGSGQGVPDRLAERDPAQPRRRVPP